MKKLLFIFLFSIVSFCVYSQDYAQKSMGRLNIENISLKSKVSFLKETRKSWQVQLSETANKTDSLYVNDELSKVSKEIKALEGKIQSNKDRIVAIKIKISR